MTGVGATTATGKWGNELHCTSHCREGDQTRSAETKENLSLYPLLPDLPPPVLPLGVITCKTNGVLPFIHSPSHIAATFLHYNEEEELWVGEEGPS